MTSLNTSLSERMVALTSELATNTSAQIADMNASITAATGAEIDRLNASTTQAIAQLSVTLHDNVTNLQESLGLLVSQNLSVLAASLHELSSEVTREFARWNGEIKAEMEDRHENVSTQLASFQVSSSEDMAALRSQLVSLHDTTRNTTTQLRQLIDENSKYSDMILDNTSAAIARSNSILAKVIGEVNKSLTDFKLNSTEDVEQLSLTLNSTVSLLNQSIQSALNDSVSNLYHSLSVMSDTWQETVRNTSTNLSQSLNDLQINTSSRFSFLYDDFSRHVNESTASLRDVRKTVADLNESTIASFSEYAVTVGQSISALNASLQHATASERNMTTNEFARWNMETIAALRNVRSVVSGIASVVFKRSESADAIPASAASAIPASKRSPDAFDSARHQSKLKADAAKLKQQQFTPGAQRRSRAEDAVEHTSLTETLPNDDWDVYDIMLASTTHADVLYRDVLELSEHFQNHTVHIKKELSDHVEELSKQVNASDARCADRISSANLTLATALSRVNDTLSMVNESHEEKFIDMRHALHDLRSALLDHMNITFATARRNLTHVAEEAWSNYTNILTKLVNATDTISALADTRHSNYTIFMWDLHKNMSDVNVSTMSSIHLLSNSTQHSLSDLNETSHSLVNAATAMFNASLQHLNVSLDAQHTALATQIMSLNTSHINDVREILLGTEQLNEQLQKSIRDNRTAIETASAAEYIRMYANISMLAQNCSTSLSNMQRSTLDDFARVNSSLSNVQAMAEQTQMELTDFQSTQAEHWVAHRQSYDDLVSTSFRNYTDLFTRIDVVKTDLLDAMDVKVSNTSSHLDRHIGEVNKSLSNNIERLGDTSSMRLMEVNASLHSSVADLRQDLLSTRSLLEESNQKESQSIRALVTATSDQDRQDFYRNMTALSTNLQSSLADTNSSIRSDMIALSNAVNSSLLNSLTSHRDMLNHYHTVMDGNVTLLMFRISQNENKLRSAEETGSNNTLRLTSLVSEMSHVSNLVQTLQSSQEVGDAKSVELQRRVDVAEAALHDNRNLTHTLHTQAHSTQQDLFHLAQNCSITSQTLSQMFHHVNFSLLTLTEQSMEANQRYTELSNALQKDSSRITLLEKDIGGQSLPELRSELSGMISKQQDTAKIMTDTMTQVQQDVSQMRTAHQDVQSRLGAVEMRVAGVIEYNLSAISSSVHSSVEKTSSRVGE